MAYASRAQHGVAGQVGARQHAQADGNVAVLASLLRRNVSCRPGRRNLQARKKRRWRVRGGSAQVLAAFGR